MAGNFQRFTFTALVVVFLAAAPAFIPADEGIKNTAEVQLQISTMPEARLGYRQSLVFPFLTGSGPLTKDNNITTVFGADVTPVSVNADVDLAWQPAAFFLLSGGGHLGSGWNMALGKGIGINAPEEKPVPLTNSPAPPLAKIFGDAFDGLVWSARGAGTLQFDLGAVIPGDWTHVLFQSRQELKYEAYTRADPHESWIFENDEGENQNGWNYYASYVLGYNMPASPVLNTIAFMAELNKSLYTRGEESWGGDLGRWVLSALFNFSFTPRFNTAFAIQMRSRRNHGKYNLYNEDYYYKDLDLLSEGGRRHILFYRVAAIMSYKLW